MTIHDETDHHRFELERLELMNRLAANMDETTARMLMAHIPSISTAEIATKADLKALELKLKSEMRVGFTEANAKIDAGLAHIRGGVGEVRGEMGEVRGEVRGTMGELRGEMAQLWGEMAQLRGEMQKNSARAVRTTIVAAMFVSLPAVATLIATVAQLYS